MHDAGWGVPQAHEGRAPPQPLIEGLRHEVLAAAHRNHAAAGRQGLQQFYYYFPEYAQLIMWKVRCCAPV